MVAAHGGDTNMPSLNGHHHVVVTVRDAERGQRLTPLVLADGQPMWPFLDYLRTRNVDLATEGEYAFAVGLLVDFVATHAEEFRPVERRSTLFNRFAHALLNGTVTMGDDPSGLWWHARSTRRVHKILKRVGEVSDWLSSTFGTTAINPFTRPASAAEQIVFWHRWSAEKTSSMMSHVKSRSAATAASHVARASALPGRTGHSVDRPPYFPDEHIQRLIETGFLVPGRQGDSRAWVRQNLRDILVTLLLHYGGLRSCEPLHLWVDDVYVDPNDPESAKVLIHHPHDGAFDLVDPVTGAKSRTTRAAYLRTFCGRVPLTEETGRRHAGWKDPLETNRTRRALEVFWFPTEAGRLFLTYYRMYIQQVRPVRLRHPWLFVTQDGEPLGTSSYAKSHVRAVRRIGLSPQKDLGTTPHGHRHSYGQRLKRSGADQKTIQVAMHHTSLTSQQPYTESDADEVRVAMERAGHAASPAPLPVLASRGH